MLFSGFSSPLNPKCSSFAEEEEHLITTVSVAIKITFVVLSHQSINNTGSNSLLV